MDRDAATINSAKDREVKKKRESERRGGGKER